MDAESTVGFWRGAGERVSSKRNEALSAALPLLLFLIFRKAARCEQGPGEACLGEASGRRGFHRRSLSPVPVMLVWPFFWAAESAALGPTW